MIVALSENLPHHFSDGLPLLEVVLVSGLGTSRTYGLLASFRRRSRFRGFLREISGGLVREDRVNQISSGLNSGNFFSKSATLGGMSSAGRRCKELQPLSTLSCSSLVHSAASHHRALGAVRRYGLQLSCYLPSSTFECCLRHNDLRSGVTRVSIKILTHPRYIVHDFIQSVQSVLKFELVERLDMTPPGIWVTSNLAVNSAVRSLEVA